MNSWRTRIPWPARYTFVLISAVSLGRGWAQTDQRSITDQINDAERGSRTTEVVAGTCGSFGMAAERERATAGSLVRSGWLAIPEINDALHSIKEKGVYSPTRTNANWLLYAYATIEGSAAYPRLQQLRGDPSFQFLDSAIDIASALSLGQTSYVSAWRRYPSNDPCTAPTPREALDQLVLAWEKNDRMLLENSLGPKATSALNALLKGVTWEVMRARFWQFRTSDKTAVGYRFHAPVRWSEPAVTLAAPQPTITLSPQHASNQEVDTSFKNVSGKDCGSIRIRLLDPQPSSGPSYLVDNSDLGALLELISRCATN